MLAVFGILKPDTFATPENARNVVTQATVVAVCALGATVVVIAGGIDLSVGSIISVTCVATALRLKAGWSPEAAALSGICIGGACGFTNGVLITTLRIVPFIVTLGTLMIYGGLAVWLRRRAGGQLGSAVGVGLRRAGLVYHMVSVRPPDSLEWMVLAPGVWLTLRWPSRRRSCCATRWWAGTSSPSGATRPPRGSAASASNAPSCWSTPSAA